MALWKYQVERADGFTSHDVKIGMTILETIPAKLFGEFTRNFDDTVQADINIMAQLDAHKYWDSVMNSFQPLFTKVAV